MFRDNQLLYTMGSKFTCQKLWFLAIIFNHLQNLDPNIEVGNCKLLKDNIFEISGKLLDGNKVKDVSYFVLGFKGEKTIRRQQGKPITQGKVY